MIDKRVHFSFRQRAKERGLAGVGEGTPPIYVRSLKHKKECGIIYINDGMIALNANNPLPIEVTLQVLNEKFHPEKSPCLWRWARYRINFQSDGKEKQIEEAKQWYEDHVDYIEKKVAWEEI